MTDAHAGPTPLNPLPEDAVIREAIELYAVYVTLAAHAQIDDPELAAPRWDDDTTWPHHTDAPLGLVKFSG